MATAELRPWGDLPIEILEKILSFLPLAYYQNFGCLCKSWNKTYHQVTVYPADRSPLLVYFKEWGDGILNCYNPCCNKTFKVDCPHYLSDTRLYFSKDGWLLLGRESEILLLNPITNTLHSFPELPYPLGGFAFFGRPPNDCIIFAINSHFDDYIDIWIWEKGHRKPNTEFQNNCPFIASPHSSPVVHLGCFYCLSEKGNLGVYDPDKSTWNILARPKRFGVPYTSDECYLAELNGELIAVLGGNHNQLIHVFRLNEKQMIWERVKSLGSKSAFVGPQGSLLTTVSPKKMQNKIFITTMKPSSRLLGVPETIQADLRISEGRIFFFSPSFACNKPKKGFKTATKDGLYSLETGQYSTYSISRERLYSIWYNPEDS